MKNGKFNSIYFWIDNELKFRNSKKDCQIKITWSKIYKNWFGLEKNFSNLKIPSIYDPDKHFAVIVSQESPNKEISSNRVTTAMKKRFKVSLCFEYNNNPIVSNDRSANNGDYVVLFNKSIDASEKNDNFLNDASLVGHKNITLLERLLLEVLYFDKTKKHLDISSLIFCFGSRYLNGDIPSVFYFPTFNRVCVGWINPDKFKSVLHSGELVEIFK